MGTMARLALVAAVVGTAIPAAAQQSPQKQTVDLKLTVVGVELEDNEPAGLDLENWEIEEEVADEGLNAWLTSLERETDLVASTSLSVGVPGSGQVFAGGEIPFIDEPVTPDSTGNVTRRVSQQTATSGLTCDLEIEEADDDGGYLVTYDIDMDTAYRTGEPVMIGRARNSWNGVAEIGPGEPLWVLRSVSTGENAGREYIVFLEMMEK